MGSDVAKLFERHDLVSAPVVDDDGVVDVIRETADHSLMSMAGLDDEEDTFAPALKTSRRRDRHVRRNHRKSCRTGCTDADCCQYGRYCRQSGTDPGDPWPGTGTPQRQ